MGSGTLCGLFFCSLIWLACGSQVEKKEEKEQEDFSFLAAQYSSLRNQLCPRGWAVHGFYCYRYFETPMNFNEAEDECQSHGNYGHLVSIHDAAESSFLANLVRGAKYDVWIGLRNKQDCKEWTWTDRSFYSTIYAPWATGYPRLCEKAVVCGQLALDSQYTKWKDVPCSQRSEYVCKKEASRFF